MILYNMFLSEDFLGAVTSIGGAWAQEYFDTILDIDSWVTLLHIATWTVLTSLGWEYEEDIRLVPVAI